LTVVFSSLGGHSRLLTSEMSHKKTYREFMAKNREDKDVGEGVGEETDSRI
jgi:hypothetical protein